jgi:hypothetical protein
MRKTERLAPLIRIALVALALGGIWPLGLGLAFYVRAIEKAGISEAELMWYGLALEGSVPFLLGLIATASSVVGRRLGGRATWIGAAMATVSMAWWVYLAPAFRLY